MRKTFLYGAVLLLLILGGSVAYIGYRSFSKETLSVLASLKKPYLAVALILVFIYHTLDNLRLFVLSRAVNLKYSFFYGYLTSFVNTFGATVTPAHVGGELTAVYMLMRKKAPVHKVMSIVTMKTLSGMAFFILALPLLLYRLAVNPEEVIVALELLAVAFLVFGAIYMVGNFAFKRNMEKPSFKKIKDTLRKYVYYLKIYSYKRKSYLFVSILSSVGLYISFLAIAPVVAKAFGKEEGLWDMFLAQIGLLYAIFASPTPGGSGVGEVGGVAVFAGFFHPFEVGAFVIIWRLISQYLSALVGGIILFVCILKDLRS